MISVVCQNPDCGKTFLTWPSLVNLGRSKHCSMKCKNHLPKGATIVQCHYAPCGKDFRTTLSKLRAGTSKYCSQACAKDARKQRTPHTCQRPECGRIFYLKASKGMHGRGKYCSKTCHKFPVLMRCQNPQCEKEFRLPPSKIRKGGGKYCSSSCVETHSALLRERYGAERKERSRIKRWLKRQANLAEERKKARERRKANPDVTRRAGRKRRALKAGALVAESVSLDHVFERDHGICTLCFKRVCRKDASVDHVIPLSKGGNHTYQNCVLAHKRCNARKRNRSIPQQQRLF